MKPPRTKARKSAPATVAAIRAKKGVLLSDEEEDEPVVKPARRKTKSDALMDWSDGKCQQSERMEPNGNIDENVVTAPRHVPGPPSTRGGTTENDEEEDEQEEESLGEDPMEMSDGVDEPKYAKANRTKKAKWPVGANGLRKRRLVRTREFTDKRGFLRMSESISLLLDSDFPGRNGGLLGV